MVGTFRYVLRKLIISFIVCKQPIYSYQGIHSRSRILFLNQYKFYCAYTKLQNERGLTYVRRSYCTCNLLLRLIRYNQKSFLMQSFCTNDRIPSKMNPITKLINGDIIMSAKSQIALQSRTTATNPSNALIIYFLLSDLVCSIIQLSDEIDSLLNIRLSPSIFLYAQ